ncbi:MAG: hypothetical protein JSV30_00810 [Candidatus Omnitrophota bacterium]|nr:MAG: hypothetical protein JSV30_00810 [Candidatus Omnitrophota bacterium]
MKRIVCILLSVILLSGCAGKKIAQVPGVSYDNGITKEEAKIIAKEYFLDSKYKNKFRSTDAGVLSSVETAQHPDSWFIMFRPKKMKWIKYKHIVGVDKKTGKITFEGTLSPSGLSSSTPY